jgi:hypothetical protein
LYTPPSWLAFPNSKVSSFLWSTQSASNETDDAYQTFGDRQLYDRTGRLHYSIKHFDGGGLQEHGGWGTDIIYFYSDDNGANWRLADGRPVASRPIVVPAAHDPNVMYVTNTNQFDFTYVNTARAANGDPVVAYMSRDGTESFRFSRFSNGQWTETNTGLRLSPAELMIDSAGIWYIASGTKIHVSTNEGRNWTGYSHGLASSSRAMHVDGKYFKNTNKFRFMVRPSGSSTVSFLEFVSPQWTAPTADDPSIPRPPDNVIVQ